MQPRNRVRAFPFRSCIVRIYQFHRRRHRLRRATSCRSRGHRGRTRSRARFGSNRQGAALERGAGGRSARARVPRTTEKRRHAVAVPAWHGMAWPQCWCTVQAMWSARARWMCPCQWPVALSAGTAALNWRLALGASRQAFNFGNVPAGARRLATRTPAVRTCHYYSTSTWLPDRKSDDTNSQMSRQT